MEDHDTGAGASAVGMSGASSAESAGPSVGRFSRHAGAHPRHADNQGENQKGKTRKRRKRRRGRKVFARDENGAIPLSVPAANPTSHPPQPAAAMPQPPVASVPRRPQPELPVFAALDLGTNNCRLLVAVPGRHGQFRVIDAFSRIVRLGEGLSASGRLGQAAMDRAVEALKVCGEKLRNRKIRKARLIATEACRAAENGVEFLERVEREAGLRLEIIDRQTEARLAVSGCGSLVERDTRGVVLFDIGGGSSEIALIDLTRGQRSPRLANHIVSWTSLPVGVVSLAERFGGRTVTRETFTAMVDDVAVRLKAFDGRDRLAHVLASPQFHLLGTSGTVTTLAGVHLDLERYDRRRVDGLWMDRQSVDRMVERLIGWDFQQRVANPCIGADRADLVLAGCAILEAIRGVWPSERLRVADRGLREGILSELMADDGVWRHDGRRA
ncbi:Ppx/GppA phosphatase family protein [Mesorhizobium sp. VK23B]|uniref:Ppx/GppA phosphatase family protein n=1 Tax=Mesorhizobium dulcispinae TaxID=3072316 RepID=A0ABU4XNS2_9HYPH|nr:MULTISPECIES: Ppx/GppA phosphatase family protein [unclassified Mesorhizobium]MDX8469122.1 Ppx/GppA phosphatase family protein [Mesorhizobium sp. VK23B]MDX8475460.1 Ppx/GppA phosphatase family protein [Mesorhizobium sp. VK23A]